MKRICAYFAVILTSLSLSPLLHSQEQIGNGLEIDRTVHDFGDIMLDSGPVSCTFTVTNNSDKPAVIYNVSSSCGCTDVKWTREPIRPGGKGTISATYSNDEGPYPFDKSLTVYFSDVRKPVILKLRGTSMAKKLPLGERYPVHIGPIGLKDEITKAGNLEQGGVKSNAVKIANISSRPINITFTSVSPELSVSISPNPVPAGETADMKFTVRASREKWGDNIYKATPVVDGKALDGVLSFRAFTKENFDALTKDQKADGPRPTFENSTFSFGKVKKGTVIDAEFEFKNSGKQVFKVYKADSDAQEWSCGSIPDAKPGQTVKFKVRLDTSPMPEGEALAVITLTTNSPLRPIVNLFIAGWIE
ncbi:MAG: DUF1573 domain-containing protein [Candidatus Cryptobacteroides sp.]